MPHARALAPKLEHAAGEGLPSGRVILGRVTDKWERSNRWASLGSSNAQYYFLQDRLSPHEPASVTFLGCIQVQTAILRFCQGSGKPPGQYFKSLKILLTLLS